MYSSADPQNKPGFGGKIPHMPKLLDQVREVIRMKHYSIRTEQSYVEWINRYIFFHNKRHPADIAEPEIRAFISEFATKRPLQPQRKLSLSAGSYCCIVRYEKTTLR